MSEGTAAVMEIEKVILLDEDGTIKYEFRPFAHGILFSRGYAVVVDGKVSRSGKYFDVYTKKSHAETVAKQKQPNKKNP